MTLHSLVHTFCAHSISLRLRLFSFGLRAKSPLLTLLLILMAHFCSSSVVCAAEKQRNILVILSYNPDASSGSKVIDSFEKQMNADGVKVNISVEALGCDNFKDLTVWHDNMRRILNKYQAQDVKPDVLLLLGQEAMATYLSQDISQVPDLPVFCAMGSRNYIEVPSQQFDLSAWTPESHDIADVCGLYNVVGGFFYEYNLEKNIELVRHYFPNVKHLALLSDNSYGGLALKSMCIDQAERFPDYDFVWLDGRNLTILSAADTVSSLPDSSALIIATWRYDKDNRFYITSSIAVLKQNNTQLPVFTLSSSGLHDWAIGGFIPDYGNYGAELAHQVCNFFATGKTCLKFVADSYVFNHNALQTFSIDPKDLPSGAEIVDVPLSVFEEFGTEITFFRILFLLLIVSLAFVSLHLRKVKALTNELKDKQEELIEAKNRAEANSLLKTSFLADMSHEIRTPLNAIVGFSQVLTMQADGVELSLEEKKNISDIIKKNSALLTGLLNGVLDISRLESGKARFKIEEVDMVDLCRTAMASVQMAQGNSDVQFVFLSAMESYFFMTDRQRVQQVVLNLLGNAVKFTKQGSITIELKRKIPNNIVAATQSDVAPAEELQISVTDTGCGVPPEKAEELFNRFVKLDEYAAGTGLGLSLCRMIVNRLGGKIWVDTSYANGAKFIFTLPALAPKMIETLRGDMT